MPDTTPPPGPPAPLPTVSTVSRQLQGVASQLHGARNDIDGLTERLKLVHEGLAQLGNPSPPATGSSLPAVAPRPSMAAQAAKGTVKAGQYVLIALGALGVAAQVAALYKPGLVGPIQTLIDLLKLLQGHS